MSYNEIHNADLRLRRKLNAMKMMSEDKEFTYEPPEMIYNRETGDVTILPKKVKKKGTLIQNYNDYEKEKRALYEELGVPDGDVEKLDPSADLEGVADKMYQV